MTNDGTAQCEESLVNVCAALVTNAQTAELMQPTERAFDDPAGFAQAAAVGPTFARQLIGDAQSAQPPVMRTASISTVALHRVGALPRTTRLAAHGRDRQHQRLQLPAVMH